MTDRRGVNFAALLASMDGLELDFPAARAESKPAPVADSLSLSVSAKNVINRRPRNESESRESRDEPEQRIDSQGNRIRISGEGSELSAKQAAFVAWETVIREKK